MAEYRVVERGRVFGKITRSPQTASKIQQRLWHGQEKRRDYGQAAYIQKRDGRAKEWRRVNIQEEA